MHTIFKNYELNNQFNEYGYVLLDYVSGAVSSGMLEKILSLKPSDNFMANQIMKSLPAQTYHCTYFDSNKAYKLKVYEILSEFYSSLTEKYLIDYEIIMANLFLKPPHSGYVTPHQNMTIVDETKSRSLSFWCPTVDTDLSNGTMQIVRGSHNNYAKFRSSSIPWKYCEFFSQEENHKIFTPLIVKAGQVVIIDDAIVHTTSANFTGVSRPVLHAIAAQTQSDLFFYDLNQATSEIKKFKVDKEFWKLYSPGDETGNLHLIEGIIFE